MTWFVTVRQIKNRSGLSSHINRNIVLHLTWHNTDEQDSDCHRYSRLVLKMPDEVTDNFLNFFGTQTKSLQLALCLGKSQLEQVYHRQVIMKEKWGLESKHFLSQSVLS